MKQKVKKGQKPRNEGNDKKKSIMKLTAIFVCLALGFKLLCCGYFRLLRNFYADYIYPIWVNTVGRLMSFFPVSMVEILLYLCISYGIFRLVRWIFSKRGSRGARALQGFLSLIVFASALFLSYTLNCGINYHRHTFGEESGLEVKERPVEELIALCEKLTEEVNSYSGQVIRNKKGLCCA